METSTPLLLGQIGGGKVALRGLGGGCERRGFIWADMGEGSQSRLERRCLLILTEGEVASTLPNMYGHLIANMVARRRRVGREGIWVYVIGEGRARGRCMADMGQVAVWDWGNYDHMLSLIMITCSH